MIRRIFTCIVIIFQCPVFADWGTKSNDWNKDNVLEKCGGISAVSPFIGSRGKLLSIEVKAKPEKAAIFRVQSGIKVVTSLCEMKEGETYMKTISITDL